VSAAIRPATSADVIGVHQVRIAAWAAAYADLMPRTVFESFDAQTATARWRGLLADGSMRALVAEVEAQVVAFCSFGSCRDEELPGVGEIYGLYAHPDRWSTGLGRDLFAAAVSALGTHPMVLWVLRDNVRARRFYEIAGWQADGAARDIALMDAVVLPEVRYRLN
jgi:GNAT superfamily N-acetyltransferase